MARPEQMERKRSVREILEADMRNTATRLKTLQRDKKELSQIRDPIDRAVRAAELNRATEKAEECFFSIGKAIKRRLR